MKKEKIILSLIILLSLFLSLLCIHNGHEWGDDFALYIEQAKAINTHSLHTLYLHNKFLLDNSDTVISPYLYPNGFPLLLSFIYRVAGMNFIVMKCFCAIFFIASLPLLYILFKNKFTNSFYPLLIVSAIALQGVFISFSDNITSDLPFFFFCILSLVLIENSKTLSMRILLGFIILFTYTIRDTGLFLLLALIVFDIQYSYKSNLFKKQPLSLLIPYIIFVIFYFVNRTLFFHDSSNLYALFKPISFSVLMNGLDYYINLISVYFFFPAIASFLKIPLLIMLITGIIITLKKESYLVVFSLLSFSVYLIWPTSQGIRYIFPILPLCTYYIAQFFVWLSGYIKKQYVQILFAILVFTMAVRGIKYSIQFAKTNTNEAYTGEMVNMYYFITDNVPANKIICFAKPRALRLFTGVNGIVINDTALLHSKADYTLKLQKDSSDIHLQPVFNTEHCYLYKIQR